MLRRESLKENTIKTASGVVSAWAGDGEHGANSLNAVDFANNWPILLPIYISLPKQALSDEKMALALRFIF